MKKISGLLVLTACVSLSACGGGGGGMGGGSGGGSSTGGGGHLGGGTGGGGGGSGGGGGGTGGGTGGGGGSGVTLAQFCGQMAQHYCARESTCQFLDPAQELNCEAVVKQGCQLQVDAVNRGQRSYDASKVAACFAAIAAYGCGNGRQIGEYGSAYTYAACDAVTGKGTAALGHSCSTDSDCLSGVCPDLNGACRTCTAYTALNQPCDFFTNVCDPSTAFCNDSSVCQAFVASGTGPCTASSGCVKGNYCTPGNDDGGTDDGGMRLCVPQLGDGQPCQSYSDCDSGVCNSNSLATDAGPDVCGVNALGGPCSSNLDCVSTAYCTTGSLCVARIASAQACDATMATDVQGDMCATIGEYCRDGVCKSVNATQQLGQECFGDSECATSLWCASNPDGGSTELCAAPVDAGVDCQFDDNACGIGFACDFDLSLCEKRSSAGGPCMDVTNGGLPENYNCTEALWCQPSADGGSSACVPWLNPGDDCTAATASCNDGMDGSGACVPDGGMDGSGNDLYVCTDRSAGSICGYNDDCLSSRCLQSDGGYLDPNAFIGTCGTTCM